MFQKKPCWYSDLFYSALFYAFLYFLLQVAEYPRFFKTYFSFKLNIVDTTPYDEKIAFSGSIMFLSMDVN